MARQSARLSSAAASVVARKRAASKVTTQDTKKRAKTKESNAPARRELGNEDEDGANDDLDASSESISDDNGAHSAFDDDEEELSSELEEDEDYDSDEKPSSRRKSGSRSGTTSSPAIRTKMTQTPRPGEKTGYGPGTQVIIKKPKARPAGKTPYEDDTLHPNTFLFLEELKANNNRAWLKSKSSSSIPVSKAVTTTSTLWRKCTAFGTRLRAQMRLCTEFHVPSRIIFGLPVCVSAEAQECRTDASCSTSTSRDASMQTYFTCTIERGSFTPAYASTSNAYVGVDPFSGLALIF
jgi:hypothetical protein